MKKIYLLITLFCALNLVSSPIQAQSSIDVQFAESPNSDCANDLVCFTIQVRSTDGGDFLGNSSIRFSYDNSVMIFDGYSQTGVVTGSYTPINFTPPPSCGGAVTYLSQDYDGRFASDFLITFVLNGNTDVLPTCPNNELTGGAWVDVSEICFEILNPNGNPNLQFTGIQNGTPILANNTDETNFNDGSNDPINKYDNGTFGDYTTNLNVSCACFPCICSPETPPTITGNNQICPTGSSGLANPTLDAGAAAPTGYTYQWQLNGTDINGSTGQTFTASQTGTYTVYLVSTDNTLCDTNPSNGIVVSNASAGCTDPTACNYDMNALCDDGTCQAVPVCNTDPCLGDLEIVDPNDACSCIFDQAQVLGCTDPNACNFSMTANCDDNSCILQTTCDTDPCTNGGVYVWNGGTCQCMLISPTVLGCTDMNACNFDTNANCDDNSCQTTPVCNTDPCMGDVQIIDPNDACSCITSQAQILGCTDPNACNYNMMANCDDNSCMATPTCNTDPCMGDVQVIDPNDACSCITSQAQILGCTDPNACNYLATANCDNGTCQMTPICNTDPCLGHIQIIDPNDACSCIFDQAQVLGCTDPNACNYNMMANCDDNSCMAAPTCNTDPCAGDLEIIDPNDACSCIVDQAQVLGCTDPNACNFNTMANCDDGSCNDGNTSCPDPCNVILGCIDPNACNFNMMANCDDGGCVAAGCNPGCTDPCSTNYDMNADADDGTCAPYNSTCNTDCTMGDIEMWDAVNCECVLVTTTVLGCDDANACNFNPAANCDDGSCIFQSTCNSDPCLAGGISTWDPTNCQCEITEPTMVGCVDPNACNYDMNANCDDATCEYTSCQTGSIGSTVFEDSNGNGMMDMGEMGIQNATVMVTGAGPDGTFGTADDVVYNLMTGSGGSFVQGGLPLGSYNIVIGLPAPYVFASGSGTYTTNIISTGLFQIGIGGVIPVVLPGEDCSLAIPLDLGWNIISSYCEPVNDDMIAIFSGIQSDVIQVKDLVDVYSPALGFSTFSGWEITNGYQVKTATATTLNINGTQEVDPLVDVIPLNSGWNIVAYWLKNGVADPIDVFANIAADVIQVKNLNGAYTPAFGFNGMGMMEPTQGYQVKMSVPNTLMYDPSDAMLKPESDDEDSRLQPVHFARDLAPHPNNATFILMDPEGQLKTEDEIAVFTHDGLLVGSSVCQDNGMAGMLIYGLDDSSDGVNGIESGESFLIKSWDAVLDEERILEVEFLQGNQNFEKDDLIVVALKTTDTGIDEISRDIKISLNPNPANTAITFDIEIEEASNVIMEVINIEGKQIDIISNQQLPKGKTLIKYPTLHLNDGMYLLKMTQGEKVLTKRFIVAH